VSSIILGIAVIASCFFVPADCGFISNENVGCRKHSNIKFCVLLHKSPSETLQMREKAYGRAAMRKMQVYEWYKHLNDGCASVIF
jgi:hypothetical protein